MKASSSVIAVGQYTIGDKHLPRQSISCVVQIRDELGCILVGHEEVPSRLGFRDGMGLDVQLKLVEV